jgi:[protein-PII] uridylyltransferase
MKPPDLSPRLSPRERLRAERERVIAGFKSGDSVSALLKGLTRATDAIVRELALASGITAHVAVIAVGGYGRGEMFPHSDVDLLLLTAADPDDELSERIETLVAAFWNCGMSLGHSVRTLADCAAEARRDVTVMTAMIEARHLLGPAALFGELQRVMAAALDAPAYFRAKLLEQQQRHTKYNETPYSLEPNCKESPGGLRDLQVLLWVARAAGCGHTWPRLVEHGLLTAEERRLLVRHERLLTRIRIWLHLVAGRREDRLVFDVQGAVAEAMRIPARAPHRASERLMKQYYRAAKVITQLNVIVMQLIEERLFPRDDDDSAPIDAVFVARHEKLDITSEATFRADANAMLRAFLTLQQHRELKDFSPQLLRALWHGRFRIDAPFRRNPENRVTFIAIFQQPEGIVHVLRRMNQWSVLGRYLPKFRRIVGQMQHDLFHAYTVDQHILQVVRNLRRFTMDEFAHEFPLCSQLAADFDRFWPLYVAALFHDIAKGRGTDHCRAGALDAVAFCRRHGLNAEDTALVRFLVGNHLLMSRIAQKEDIADPGVVRRFADTVGDERRLIALYLLTVADVRGTSPKVWNSWKAKLLEDLFHFTRRMLNGDAAPALAELEQRKRTALDLMAAEGAMALAADAHETLWRQLDVVYFLRHSARAIAWHTRALLPHLADRAAGRAADRAFVQTRLPRTGEGAEVLLYTRDQHDLFARVCGYFDNRGLSILDAKIHTTRDGYALDTFLVSDHGRGAHPGELLDRINRELPRAIDSAQALPPPAKGNLSRRSRHFPVLAAVHLQPGEDGRHFLLNITATDRIGLLYAIARVLVDHRINVHTARINTLGERVEDVLLIDGAKLNDARTQLEIERDLLAALAP